MTRDIIKHIRIGTAEQTLLAQIAARDKRKEADALRALIYEGAAARGIGTAQHKEGRICESYG